MLQKFKSFLKFSASSVISFLVDYGVFTLLNALVLSGMASGAREFAATYGARVISSVLNFILNKKLVFRSEMLGARSALRYALLAIVQAALSAWLIHLLQRWTGATALAETLLKLPVDLALFISSYAVQKYWVFPQKKT